MKKLTCSNVRANSTPAMPARMPPITNVVTTMRSTSMPIRLAISWSSATARIDFPVFVRETNTCRMTIATIDTTNTTTWIRAMGSPKIVHVPVRISGFG